MKLLHQQNGLRDHKRYVRDNFTWGINESKAVTSESKSKGLDDGGSYSYKEKSYDFLLCTLRNSVSIFAICHPGEN